MVEERAQRASRNPWLTAFVDVGPEDHERTVTFWLGVTGYSLSPVRGEHGQFATLLPPAGDAHLRVQRLAEGPSRIHLDVHVPDPGAAVVRAVELGATVAQTVADVAVMCSPGGLPFCLVREHERVPAPPLDLGGHHSIVDQVSVDVAPTAYDAECEFWSALLELPLRGSTYQEFRSLERPADAPVRILLQRCDDEVPTRAHLDLACDDRAAETTRHVELGATVVRRHDGWTTLRDPAGLEYCITDRTPRGGAR